MIFLSLIVVLVLVQWWGSGAPLQYDGWFVRWINFLQAQPAISGLLKLQLFLAVFVPVAALVLLLWFVGQFISVNGLLLIYIPVLLFSLGRGNFSSEVKNYIAASERGDNVVASRLVDELRGTAGPSISDSEVTEWQALHTQALQIISYRGFERMFAVLFWFFLLGAAGALLYRLSVIYREHAQGAAAQPDNRVAARWLWLLEWPAVRVMGLTWALVGNFEACYRCWKSRLLDTKSASMVILAASMNGALGVEDSSATPCDADKELPKLKPNEPAYSLSLVRASLPLFSRSLLLWVCVVALVTLFV